MTHSFPTLRSSDLRSEDFPPEKFEAIIRINMNSAWYLYRAAVPFMKAKKWGRIIATASAHSLVASPNKTAYVMAKHGIAGLTKTLALEMATDGGTVKCISPGYVWRTEERRVGKESVRTGKVGWWR